MQPQFEQTIKPYKDTGKYLVIFKGKAEPIKKIDLGNSKHRPQGPFYTNRELFEKAKKIDDLTNT